MTLDFKEAGDIILLIGESTADINSSEYLHKVCAVEYSPAPLFDLDQEFALQQKIAELIKKRAIVSAHDVSEGGLFIALAESAFVNDFGFDVVASDINIRKDAYWFGESQSRVVVSVRPEKMKECKEILGGYPFEELGFVTQGYVEVDGMNWNNIYFWKEKYDSAIEDLLAGFEKENALSSL
jgi:phosphoribosylformylglycinamidine (FGAM) synthase-like enzyme